MYIVKKNNKYFALSWYKTMTEEFDLDKYISKNWDAKSIPSAEHNAPTAVDLNVDLTFGAK